MQRRLAAGRRGVLQSSEADGAIAPLVENADQVEAAFGRLAQDARTAIRASCNQSSVAMPLAETMSSGCASCGDPYVEGEQVIMTRCIHPMHARCFLAWVGANYEKTMDLCMPWRLQCPQCREFLG